MATQKQIDANRRNAKRSTGPKTAAGRAKSSRNAYRHGLSRSLPLDDPAFRARMDKLMQDFLDGNEPTDDNMAAAAEAAEAQLRLLQAQTVRVEAMKEIIEVCDDLKKFRLLYRLDRYVHRAQSKRRRATEKLSQNQEWIFTGTEPIGRSR